MSHPRTDVRNRIAERIRAGRTGAGERVYRSRTLAVLDRELETGPVVLVYGNSERSTTESHNTGLMSRTIDVYVDIAGRADGDDDIDEMLDSIAAEIEDLIDSDTLLQGSAIERPGNDVPPVATSVALTQSDLGLHMVHSRYETAVLRLTFAATYLTQRVPVAAETLDPFVTAHVDSHLPIGSDEDQIHVVSKATLAQ